jgi:glycosyltransferase involved in cell wall biosynthesis
LYYGSYLPLHGIETVIEAARLLDHRSPVRFRIIGQGMRSQYIRQMAQDYQLTNVQFAPSVPLRDLPAEISRAALCLGGHFSAIPKASRVIAGKTFQCLAMGKATIVGDNPANAELLTHAESAWFCPMNDPQALAAAISQLMDDPALSARLGEAGRQVFLQKASVHVLSAQIRQMVLDVTGFQG